MILKLVSLDGRVAVPGRRWVTGEASRRRVHELRASVDAVGVGMGTVPADAPRLDARDVPVRRLPRRLAFGRGPLPEGRARAAEPARPPASSPRSPRRACSRSSSRRGPRIATSFLAVGRVDRLLLFVAPVLAGDGPAMLGCLAEPLDLGAPGLERLGDDLLLDWRLQEV